MTKLLFYSFRRRFEFEIFVMIKYQITTFRDNLLLQCAVFNMLLSLENRANIVTMYLVKILIFTKSPKLHAGGQSTPYLFQKVLQN